MGFPISIPGVRNVLQSQEVFLMDAKSNFFNFEDREESYTSNCMYFERQIHWCTQNHLWTSSSMHQEGSIRNISVPILAVQIYNFWSFVTLISLSWMKKSTPILFQMKSMVGKIKLEPIGVLDIHLRSQEHPSKSGSVPD